MEEENEERTRPWDQDEYLVVDGLNCVYTVQEDGTMRVHLPGGGVDSIGGLRAKGRALVMPGRMRAQ